MSAPLYDKNNPIPGILPQATQTVKLVFDALDDGCLTQEAQTNLISKLSDDAGPPRRNSSAEAELAFWLAQVRAIPLGVKLSLETTSNLHPVVASALVSEDPDAFFAASSSRYWTNDGLYRRRAPSAPAQTLTDSNTPGTDPAPGAHPAPPGTTMRPQTVPIEGVGDVPAYRVNDLPRGTDDKFLAVDRLFVDSTQLDMADFPAGCVFQMIPLPKNTLVSTQAAIGEDQWVDEESQRMDQLIQLAGSAPARPPISRAQTAPSQVLSSRFPTVQQQLGVVPPLPAGSQTPLVGVLEVEDESHRYRLGRLTAARFTPAYSSDPKHAGVFRTQLQRQGVIKMDVIEVMKIMSGGFVDISDVVHRQEAELFDSYTDNNGIEFKGIQARAQKKASRTKPPVTDFSKFIRALKEIEAVENAVFGTYDGADWTHYLKFLDEMHAGAQNGFKGAKLPIAFDDCFCRMRAEPNNRVTSLLEASKSHAAYVNTILLVAALPNNPELEERTKSSNGKDWICIRYNRRQPHPLASCGRKHVCLDCKAKDHRSGDSGCPNLEIGIGHKLAKMAAKSSAHQVPLSPHHDSPYDSWSPPVHPPPSLLAGIRPAPRIQRRFHFGPLARATYTPAQLHLIRRAHRMYPSQFSFVRTIDDTKFETLLLQHPNRALVRSFIHGFRSEGFEPEHDGSVASGDDPATLTFPRSEDHRSFIQTTIDDEVAKGWLSPGTAFPIPGATYNPVFVVESANHRMRVVADHTRSGLNDGISRAACPTVYDSIIDFICLLRSTSLSAFKVLVMSKDWQARQGIAIRCRLPDGALVTWYHIEWRGVFGCRAIPFLWTRFTSLVVWIAHHSYGIEHPLAYMDDTFGVNIEGRLVSFVHNGETHVIPSQQARMATLWSSLGLPFKLTPDKAPFGQRVTITGIYCDLDDFSISLTPKAVNDLATAIQAFLDFPGRCPPLRQWRQMTGWLSWALNIAPQARPHVTPLYNKIGTKTAAQRWCPNQPGSPQGAHLHCPPFAEALTVVVALDLATSGAFGSSRRVLVRTNSAPAVYALDSGACSDTKFLPLRTLTLRAFATASSRRFDLKVQHVAGDAVMTPTTPGVGRGVSFASRPLPGPHLHTVHPLADDIAFSNELVARALEPRTRSDYQRSLR
ncbi:BQ5605_C006g03839 [Microbotryum silenes-dioicae]|uniref:BQ5605_C006g03839 protein n=1 Tax=Microbotryum silenes-dioicae TaxID=796604 RepID=A0A2X0M562_9BASI|nr:BQ5605_C006g03839 [Microbotryum silenes-dioicae]